MLRREPGLAWETSTWGETGLQAASHLGHRSLIAELAAAGVELDLFAACASGEVALARTMLCSACSCVTGVHGLPLLHFGVVSRSSAMIDMLLAHGVSPNCAAGSLPPLHSAVAIGSVAAVKRLAAAGADTAAVDAYGASAVDWAVRLHGTESPVVRILTDHVGATDSRLVRLPRCV